MFILLIKVLDYREFSVGVLCPSLNIHEERYLFFFLLVLYSPAIITVDDGKLIL